MNLTSLEGLCSKISVLFGILNSYFKPLNRFGTAFCTDDALLADIVYGLRMISS